MILRIQCPHCGTPYRLSEPLPPEGKRYRCKCAAVITVAYPEEVRARLRADAAVAERGTGFAPGAPPEAEDGEEEQVATRRMDAAPGLTPFAPMASRRVEPSGREIGLTEPPRIPSLEESLRRSPPPPPYDRGPPTPPLRPASPVVANPGPSAPRPTTEPGARRPAPPPFVPRAETRPAPADLAPPPSAPAPPPAPSARPRPRPAKPVPRQSSRRRWLTRLAVTGGLLALLAGGTLGVLIVRYRRDLPSVQSLATYEPLVGTLLTDEAGRFVGEFFHEQRYVVAFEEIPEDLRNAFIAAEDAAFFEHGGLDFLGIARAMLTNVREGRMAQGASTITQQVARSFLLSREKKLERKLKEAILAYRVESNFSKEHILYLYLNQIFLGHGAYGVQAAAHLYFGKEVQELTLSECAIIAGLPQAPSNYSPNRNFKAAKARQRYVLDQMARRDYITEAEADAAYAAPMEFAQKRDRNLDVAPFYVEHVRRYLFEQAAAAVTFREENPDAMERHPYEGIHPLDSGLTVTLPIDLELQAVANAAVREGVRGVDKRIGWRGSPKHLDAETERAAERLAIDRQRAVDLRPYHPSFELPKGPVPADLLPALRPNEITRGVIKELGPTWAIVEVGSLRGLLPVEEFSWCHKVNPEQNFKFFKCRTLDDVLKVGDVIDVRVKNEGESWLATLPTAHADAGRPLPRLSMEQSPAPEAALLSMRTSDGGVLAMVGGTSFEGSEFNRAVQARRQVGSTFKPLVYAAALDAPKSRFTVSSILVDAPIIEEMTGKDGELWKPANSGDEYLGDTTLRRGLILSRNIVTLKICQEIGISYALEYVQRFGIESPVDPNLASCLGASALTLLDMLRAYSVFPTLGTRVEPRFVTEVRDRHGALLETHAPELTPDAMSPETAFIMVSLMLDVVRSGTARMALEVGVPVAGKTGTTNAFKDAWFMGYTPEIVTGVWIGLDEFKSMGRGQFGGEISLPIWVEYMSAAVKTYPPSEYPRPDKIRMVSVDSLTGKLTREGQAGVSAPFLRGTEPTEFAPAVGQVDAADFLSGEY